MDVVTIAETYSLTSLRNKVYRFMSENLQAFAKQAEFHRLSPQQLEHLLDSDFPVDVSEARVLEILLNWLDVEDDLTSSCAPRMAHAHKLLRKVNFAEIHPAHLSAILRRKLSSNLLPKSFLSRVQALVEDSNCGNGQNEVVQHLINSRGMEEAVVKVSLFSLDLGTSMHASYYSLHRLADLVRTV